MLKSFVVYAVLVGIVELMGAPQLAVLVGLFCIILLARQWGSIHKGKQISIQIPRQNTPPK